MKTIKSLILGSAAGLVALSGAQAADLPVKAKAVEYVRVCSLYGAGFYYIPGTDTCIKLGGYLRVDTGREHATARQPATASSAGWPAIASRTPSLGAPVKTSPSIRAPRPNTAWFAPTSMRPSPGPTTATRQLAPQPASERLLAARRGGVGGRQRDFGWRRHRRARRLLRVHPVRRLHDG